MIHISFPEKLGDDLGNALSGAFAGLGGGNEDYDFSVDFK